ncbi:aminotransferase class IV [Cyanobium sp. FACHB-13342]|uniref:aminotransferase class IV n=1 Tax=Cyanobium sp. FACHB-13342 TaxID=2692793 RepID=UPI001680846C|nr:aminotransferase class IV [Cyanobium sp. FACHB-13342]MBD2424116.1 aminotransferase class IV [Cyanobium sp. FACHB-13342]
MSGPPPAAIAWVGDAAGQGRWGSPDALTLPISDRGLLLADGLFETLLVDAGEAWLVEEHLGRWQRSAALLALPPPPSAAIAAPLIAEAIARSGITRGALRLNWSRGGGPGGGRGIAITGGGTPSFWLQLSAAAPSFTPLRVIVSPTEERSATSLLSRCKTFAYGPAIQARRQAQEAGADDALLPSSAGGLCCATTANLLVRREGRWLTPPLSSGCLPGVMRQRALDQGLVAEAPIAAEDLLRGEAAWLINSLGCRPISHLGETPLGGGPTASSPETGSPETFWRALLSLSCSPSSKSDR